MNRYLLCALANLMLFFAFSCSSDSEDPTPEPDVTAPKVDFSISGAPSNVGSSPIVVSNQIQVNINAQDSGGIAKVEAFIDDQKVGEDNTSPYQITIDLSGYTSKNSLTAKFQDYVLKVTVTDTSGNVTSEQQVIHIDNELPTISEVSLENGQVISGNTNSITFNVTDNEGLSGVKTYLNNELLLEFANDEYEININTLDLSDGENILKIEAVDLAENMVDYEVAFISDNTGPNISLATIDDIVYDSFFISPKVEDEHSEIHSVEILWGEESLVIFQDTNNINYEVVPTNLPVGSNLLVVKAMDKALNESITEIPLEVHRKLITVNFPLNFLTSYWESLYVFASSMENGSVWDVKRITNDTQQVVLSTNNEIGPDTEFMLTFAEYSTYENNTTSSIVTIQNLKPYAGEITLKKILEFDQEEPIEIPVPLSDGTNGIFVSASGFGYGGSSNSAKKLYLNKRKNKINSVNTDVLYFSLIDHLDPLDAGFEYGYIVVDRNLPTDFILNAASFSTDGVEKRTYQPTLYDAGVVTSANLELLGYFSEEDFQNNVHHRISSEGYAYAPSEGVPYYMNTIFQKYRYKLQINDYYTERTGEPLASYTTKDWSIDFIQNNKEITLTKNGYGHHVGKVSMIPSTWPPEVIDGVFVNYAWSIIFDSQKMEKIIMPDLPEELKSWGIYHMFEKDNINVEQVELKSYDGISSFSDYYKKIIQPNKNPYSVSPIIESKFKNRTEVGFPYLNLSHFLLD